MSQIVTSPNAVLRQLAKPVDKLDKRILGIIDDMVSTLKAAKHPEGVGLAAPQIGITLRIFLIRPLPDKTITIFINPEITRYSQRTTHPGSKDGVYEGCLSLPGHYAPVSRSISVTVKFQTIATQPGQSERAQPDPASAAKWEDQWNWSPVASTRDWTGESQLVEKTEVFSGFPAHIIQHELDHLNGLLFIDRVLQQNTKLFKVDGSSWHEISL